MDILDNLDLRLLFSIKSIDALNKPVLKCLCYSHENSSNLITDILNTHVGYAAKYDQNNGCIPEKPFVDLASRHESIRIDTFFKKQKFSRKNKIIQGKLVKCPSDVKKCENQASLAEILEGFRLILHILVTKELIGNDRNKKKILKTLRGFMLTAKTEPFSLCTLVKQLNISTIQWLNNVDNQHDKYVLIAKFIKWLFKYFMVIIFKLYHMTYVNHGRVFIHLSSWTKEKKKYIRRMEAKKKIVLLGSSESKNIQLKNINRLFLIPKNKGIRPVVKNMYTDEKMNELRIVLPILLYLHKANLKEVDNDFKKKYVDLVNQINNSDKKVYLVVADIQDAFASIIQNKLFDIIKVMFADLPCELTLQWSIVRNRKKYKFTRSEPCRESNRTLIIDKDYALSIIKDFIFNTQIIMKNKIYLICKGIAQGLILSSTLCDIYYTHMKLKYFSVLKSHGQLFSYVDDFIYITEKLEYAQKFLNQARKGIPEYNCWFNKEKLSSNINISGISESVVLNNIQYLGLSIDPDSLEVQPKYLCPRNSINYNSLTLLNFEKKITNFASLKLTALILNKKINSYPKIMLNVKLIALQHAKRCFALVNCLKSSLKKGDEEAVSKMIRRSNYKVLQKIFKYIEWNEDEKRQNLKTIRSTFWKNFNIIFNKCNKFNKKVIKS